MDDRSSLYATHTFGSDTRPTIRAKDRAQALRALIGDRSVVYAIRLPDGIIKIGCTGNLQLRRNHFKGGEIVGFTFGDFDDEKTIHDSLTDHRARGVEYYHATPEVLTVVNGWRDDFGLPRLAA